MSMFGKGWQQRLELISAVFDVRKALGLPYPDLEELDRISDIAAMRANRR